MKVFVICSKGLKTLGLKYVNSLENQGHKVFFPLRDTKQVKTTAKAILHSNKQGMLGADEAHIIWDGSSYGSIFDLGMAYALEKPIKVVHLPNRTWLIYLKKNLGSYLKDE